MINKIKEIRQQTGVSLGLCEKALKETDGDIDKAKELLRKWGQALAGKRGGRDTRNSREAIKAYYFKSILKERALPLGKVSRLH